MASPLSDALRASWAPSQISLAVSFLARGLGIEAHEAAGSQLSVAHTDNVEDLVQNLCEQLSLELTAVRTSVRDLASIIEESGSVFVPVYGPKSTSMTGLLLLAKVRGQQAFVVDRSYRSVRLPLIDIVELAQPGDRTTFRDEVQREQALLKLAFPERSVRGRADYRDLPLVIWVLRPQSGVGLRALLSYLGVTKEALFVAVTQVLSLVLVALAWLLIAKLAFSGSHKLSNGWFWAMVLAVFGYAAFSTLSFVSMQRVTLGSMTLLQRLMLGGAFARSEEKVRSEGTGQTLTRALDGFDLSRGASMLGTRVLSGAISCLVVLLMLALSNWPILLTLGFTAALAFGCALGLRTWTAATKRVGERVRQTHHLFNTMSGLRTISTQGIPWTLQEEDAGLAQYVQAVSDEQSSSSLLVSIPGYLWLIAVVVILATEVIRGEALVADVIYAGGVGVAGFHALGSLLKSSAAAMPFFAAGRRVLEPMCAALVPVVAPKMLPKDRQGCQPILSLKDVDFAFPNAKQAVFRGANIDIFEGDRILLQGPSGAGKSTFVSLLAGLRSPTKGLMFVDGFDVKSVGVDTLKKITALSPQFHENAIIPQTLLFNLSLGRRWPPTENDRELAEQLCQELALADLLDRMPERLDQRIGEGGWYLSHGERCRVFLARTLMQQTPLVVLDESFSALDPETLMICLETVLRRAKALVIIEHFHEIAHDEERAV